MAARILQFAKHLSLSALRTGGGFALAGVTPWRRDRLLILCYHGLSVADEHLWSPGVYITPELFVDRLKSLKRQRCTVLPLESALQFLSAGALPARSVVLTFDDGFADFATHAAPILRGFGFPATVYLTTYYCDHNVPLFGLMCSYLLWRGRSQDFHSLANGPDLPTIRLESPATRHLVRRAFHNFVLDNSLPVPEQTDLLQRLAASLHIDFAALLENRQLHLMSPNQVQQISREGFDIQMHTHTHDTPTEPVLFAREVTENRSRIHALTGTQPCHFAYPSGFVQPSFPGWLGNLGVKSAVTVSTGLAHSRHNRLLLPRVSDTQALMTVEFEAWLCGARVAFPTRVHSRPLSGRDAFTKPA